MVFAKPNVAAVIMLLLKPVVAECSPTEQSIPVAQTKAWEEAGAQRCQFGRDVEDYWHFTSPWDTLEQSIPGFIVRGDFTAIEWKGLPNLQAPFGICFAKTRIPKGGLCACSFRESRCHRLVVH